MSVWSMIQETVRRSPDRPALTVKRNGGWVTWTYRQYEAEIVTVAKAFIKLGLKPHHSVGILGKSLWSELPRPQVWLQVTMLQSGTSPTLPQWWLEGWQLVSTPPPAWPASSTGRPTAGPTSWWWRTRSSWRSCWSAGTVWLLTSSPSSSTPVSPPNQESSAGANFSRLAGSSRIRSYRRGLTSRQSTRPAWWSTPRAPQVYSTTRGTGRGAGLSSFLFR